MGIVDTAQKYVGKVKYVFGANNIPGGKGDCSSFTQYVFQKNGVSIGRTTDVQWTKGKRISKNELQPGDLVFFQGTYRAGVSHVGIYAGNGKFIHNSSSKGVTVSNLSDSYYVKHWLGGRRISGADGGTFTDTGDSSDSVSSGTANQTNIFSGDDALKWWGDIAVVLFIMILIVGGVFFLSKSFGFDIFSI